MTFKLNPLTNMTMSGLWIGGLISFPLFLFALFKHITYPIAIEGFLGAIFLYFFVNSLTTPVKKIVVNETNITIYHGIIGIGKSKFDIKDVSEIKLTKLYTALILFEAKVIPLNKIKSKYKSYGISSPSAGQYELRYYLTFTSNSLSYDFPLVGWKESDIIRIKEYLSSMIENKFKFDDIADVQQRNYIHKPPLF